MKQIILDYCDIRQKELTEQLHETCDSVTCYTLQSRIKEIELLRNSKIYE